MGDRKEEKKKREEEEEEEKKKEEEEEEEEEEEDCVWKKLNNKELEEQYSPSRWSKSYSKDEIILEHIKQAEMKSQLARQSVPTRLDILYGGSPTALLDVYGEDLPKDAPMLVYVHGGYWQDLHKNISSYFVLPLYKAGVLSVVLGYDLAPKVGVADIVKEVKEGVAWACELARGRGSAGVILAGWSAGGHLVMQALAQGLSQPQLEGQPPALTLYRDLILGVVTLSGVFDLRPLVGTYVNDALNLTLESAWALSPLRVVGGLGKEWGVGVKEGKVGVAVGGLEVLVVVGGQDSPEFKRQSKHYHEACLKAGISSQHKIIEDADHFSLVCDLSLDLFPLTSDLQAFVTSCCGKRKRKEEEEEEEEEEGEKI